MCCIARDDRQTPRITCGDLVLQPVIAAIFRADRAESEQAFKLLDLALEFAPVGEFPRSYA